MNKKRWIVVFVLAVAAALCIFIFPRKAERVLDLSQEKVESIFVTTTKGTDDPQRHTTTDKEEIAAAMALLRELQAKRTFDDNSVTILNDAYNAKIDLAYVHGAARFEVGEWGWLRYREQNYMAQDSAVTKELLELVKSWKIS